MIWPVGRWRDDGHVTQSRWRLKLECGCTQDINCNFDLPDQVWCERCCLLCHVREANDRG